MYTTELIGFLIWFKIEVRSSLLINKYKGLLNVLNSNTQPNKEKTSFEEQLGELLLSLRRVRLIELTATQEAFAERIGLKALVGSRAIERIESVVYKNAIDPATAFKKISIMQKELATLDGKMKNIYDNLSTFVDFDDEEIESDEVMFRVIFKEHSGITNIVELKHWGEVWHRIARGIAMANEKTPEDIRVTGASRGSLVIELATVYGCGHMLIKMINSVLGIVERVQAIKLKEREIRALDLANNRAELELRKSADELARKGKKEVLVQVIGDKNLPGDTEKALAHAISGLLNFLTKGGEVDVYLPPKEEYEDEEDTVGNAELVANQNMYNEMRDMREEMRGLEAKVNLIEFDGEWEDTSPDDDADVGDADVDD